MVFQSLFEEKDYYKVLKGNKMYRNLNSKVLNYIIIYTIIVVKEKY